jgi:predicted CopG family antitoxin
MHGQIKEKIMKASHKNAQMTIRISEEMLEKMKQDAKQLNLSLSDFIIDIYQKRESNLDLEMRLNARLEALERAVFHQSQAA